MASNVTNQSRNVFSKKLMVQEEVEAPVAEQPEADRDKENSDSASEIEEAMPARRQYKTCVVFPNNPLGSYDEARVPTYSCSIPTLRMRDRANYILSLRIERRNILRLACEANFWKYGLYPPESGVKGAEGPTRGPNDVPTVEETFPGGEHTPYLDDKIPLSRLARIVEKREKALHQCLARGGTPSDPALSNRPRGQGFARPTRPLPASRGNGKATISDSNMASRLMDLAAEPSGRASSGCPKAKVAQITRSSDAIRYKPLEGCPARVALTKSWLARSAPLRVWPARNQVTNLAAEASKLGMKLGNKDQALQLALDG
uniref:Uncharacterized protein n=1 Tax=Cannabis sativa TaxID=3483 RepID=A0A803NJM0_CANSA